MAGSLGSGVVMADRETVLPPIPGAIAGESSRADPGAGISPYRASLYTNDEMMAGYEPGAPETTLDARIGAATLQPASPAAVIARGIHDACIDLALARTLREIDRPVVGVMGSHGTPRGAPEYRMVADLGRRLGRAGLLVVTGGGPGLMEAANLGAWLADEPDAALPEAIDILERSPRYHDDPATFLERAREVRARWPDGGINLGVPTWLYVDEPSNQFVTFSAKYFQNSVRENGLLAIALAGVIYTTGGSGTAQEIFTDAAQNEYTMYGVRSPMILLGPDYADDDRLGLVTALRALAKRGGWEHLVRSVADPESAVAAISELRADPPGATAPPRTLRKR